MSQQPIADAPKQPKFPVGVWESPQADGSTIGIDLSEVPASIPDAVLPEGTPRPAGTRLQIGVFQRQHRRIACGEENFFISGWTGPDAGRGASDALESYANGKLTIHYYDRFNHSEIHVELVLDPLGDVWTGHFDRGKFDAEVMLKRTSFRPDPAQGGCVIWAGPGHGSLVGAR